MVYISLNISFKVKQNVMTTSINLDSHLLCSLLKRSMGKQISRFTAWVRDIFQIRGALPER